MREKTIDIWKKKLDWVAEHGGMALVTTHPDYMHFGELATDTFCSILARRVHGRTRTLLNRGLRGLRQTTADILSGREEYPVMFYEQLLEYIKAKYEGRYWHVLPREMAGFWRNKKID